MKYTLILILACTPLFGLTAWSAFDLFRHQVVPREVEKVDFQEASNIADLARSRAEGDQAAADQWAQSDLFDPRAHELKAASSETAGRVVDGWRRVQEIDGLVVKIGEAMAASTVATDDPQRQIAEQLTTLQGLVTQQRSEAAAKVEGADRIFQVLDVFIEQLKRKKDNLENREKIEKALQLATERLESKKQDSPTECLALLDAEPLKSVRDPDLLAQKSRLRGRAQYHRALRDLFALKQQHILSKEKLLEAYDGFLRAHPKSPTDFEKRAHDRIINDRAEVRVEVGLTALGHSAELEMLLTLAAALTGDDRAPDDVKPRARTQVRHWLLTKGFPEKDPPDCLLGREEAVTKTGDRLIGYFYLPAGVDQWRYWKSSKNRETNPRGDKQIAQSDFTEPPSKPKYVELTREYNERREKLIDESASKQEWQSFARRCEDMQKELTKYRDRWGFSEEADKVCRDLTFEVQATVARQLIDRWDRYRAIFEE